MVKSEEKTIQGLKFQLGMLPAFQSLEAMPRVLKLVGPAMGGFKTLILSGALAAKDRTKIAASAVELLGSLGQADPNELVAVARLLLSTCRVQEGGKWTELVPVFDVVLQGRMFTVLNLIAWAVQLNYHDFFDLLPTANNDGSAAAGESSSAPPSISTPS